MNRLFSGRSDMPFALLLLAPSLLLLGGLVAWPMVSNIEISFLRLPLNPNIESTFVGVSNYVRILSDPDFWHSLWMTVWYTALVVAGSTVLGLALFLIITLFPFFVMLMTSFKGAKEAISLHPTLLPQQWTLEHYVDIFNPMIFPFVDYFRNSLVVSVVSSVVAVFLGILGAYALSRLRFKGRMTINASFYTVYMFSGILLVVPLFKIITALGIYDTEMALIITMVTQTLPTAVFMLKSYFDTIPDEIEEAAMMDGLNRLQIIFRITVPLAMSGLISVFVYCFMVAWNDYLFASIFLSSASNFTLPVGLNALFSTPDYIWGRMMAASLVTALPVVIMYALSERFIKSGLTAGGVKG